MGMGGCALSAATAEGTVAWVWAWAQLINAAMRPRMIHSRGETINIDLFMLSNRGIKWDYFFHCSLTKR